MVSRRPFIICLAAMVCVTALAVAIVRADRIVLKDGRTVEGEIKAEDNQTLTIESMNATTAFTQKIRKSQIDKWYRPAREGATYVTLPIVGVIGHDVTAPAVRAGLAEARKLNPKYVVLAIDSPGGQIGEMAEIVDVLTEASKDTQIIAYVKKAYSAAAVIAMTCRDIYMTPDSSIGATVAFRMTDGGPREVEAKFKSIIDAKMRSAAAQGRHADLLIRGMSEINLELYLAYDLAGKPTIALKGPGKLIKSRGQILCLTAAEAIECGLASGTSDITDLGKQVAGGAWHEPSRKPWNALASVVARQRAEYERMQRLMVRGAVMDRIEPEVVKIEHRIAELAAQMVAAKDALALLQETHKRELKRIDEEYQQALHASRSQADPAAAAARAVEAKNTRAGAARAALQSAVADWNAKGEAAFIELSLLRERHKSLLATVPTD